MNYSRNRKYPRVYQKNIAEQEEKSIELSAAAAVGILAVTLLNGIALGYIIKKRMG